jgi:hypothetical protein
VCGLGGSNATGGDSGGGVPTSGGSGGASTTGGNGIGGAFGTTGGISGSLLHRYSFEGTEPTVAADSIGTAHGTIIGAQLSGKGDLVLAGGKAVQYVDLPNFILKGLSSATFEAWVTWNGGREWQRIFDFGEDISGVDTEPGLQSKRVHLGRSYIFCTPRGLNGVRVTFGKPGLENSNTLQAGEPLKLDARDPLPTGEMQHVAVVVNATTHKISLYIQGGFQGEADFNDSLDYIYDIDNWLGRSHFEALGDEMFDGTFHEFRIYATALDPSQIIASHLAGPDVVAVP